MPIPFLKIKSSTPRNSQTIKTAPRKLSFNRSFLFKKLLPIITSIIVIGFFLVIALFFYLNSQLPSPEGVINRQTSNSTTIYDKTGKIVLYSVHGGIKRIPIKLTDLPDYVKWASITIEDKNFYQHQGIDLKGTLRAIVVDIISGNKAQGGSSITQQFIKNAVLTSDKSFIRKFKEWILAYQFEKKFNKEQILEMYFNEIPYGSVVYGVEAAAQTFFNKSAKDLTVLEGATLAALVQRPTYFSPYGNNREELINRAKYIIDQMVINGHLTKTDATQAKKQVLKFKPREENILAPHFVIYIKELLAKKYGENFIEQEGLKVYTTLDWDLQQKAEKILAEQVAKNTKDWQASNASLVALDAKTGQILAMVGSADYFNEKIDGQVNVALKPRQPGSSFKPIVYTAAFKKGYTLNTVLFDLVTKFLNTDGQDYTPHNYDGKEHGPVTIKQALAGSLNIPAVKTIYLTGIDNVLNLADELGYTTLKDRSRFGLSLVLGGGEVTLLEHTQAFSVLAQEGLFHPTAPILKITDKQGRVLEEYQKIEKSVLDPEIARQTTDILADNSARAYIFGEKNYLTLADRPVAAKTGTTNNFRDAWTIGYTPSYVVGVWVGNSDNQEMKAGADGSKIAAPIWQKTMTELVKNTTIEPFTSSTPIITNKPVLDGQIGVSEIVKIDKASKKLATELTPVSFIEEKKYQEVHDILYYVNKDDPRGAQPSNPTDDPQYLRWEEPVQNWANQQNYLTNGEQSPTQLDDLHTLANQPSLEIINPTSNSTIKDDYLNIQLNTSAPRGIYRLEFYLDNTLVKTYNGLINNQQLNLTNLVNNFHTLKIKSFDDIDNSKEVSVDFNLLR